MRVIPCPVISTPLSSAAAAGGGVEAEDGVGGSGPRAFPVGPVGAGADGVCLGAPGPTEVKGKEVKEDALGILGSRLVGPREGLAMDVLGHWRPWLGPLGLGSWGR